MMSAIEAGTIPKADLSAFTARQLINLGDDELAKTVQRVWGDVRQTSAAKLAQIEQYRKQLSPKIIAQGNRAQGRLVFKTFCAVCHKLFDDGGAIGPDLTGSDRRNLDYVLENLIDPSAAVSKDFQMVVVSTTGGRVLTGMIRSETDRAIMIQTPGESITVPKDEIQARQIIPVSMMPEGLLLALKPDQIRDLIAYLQSAAQVDLP